MYCQWHYNNQSLLQHLVYIKGLVNVFLKHKQSVKIKTSLNAFSYYCKIYFQQFYPANSKHLPEI